MEKFSMDAPWREAARAAQQHQMACRQCAAAGQGYGQRCEQGRSLWDAYRAAFGPTTAEVAAAAESRALALGLDRETAAEAAGAAQAAVRLGRACCHACQNLLKEGEGWRCAAGMSVSEAATLGRLRECSRFLMLCAPAFEIVEEIF